MTSPAADKHRVPSAPPVSPVSPPAAHSASATDRAGATPPKSSGRASHPKLAPLSGMSAGKTAAPEPPSQPIVLPAELAQSTAELLQVEIDLIDKAGEFFNNDAFRDIDDPRDYKADDPARWAALIALSSKLKQVQHCMARPDCPPAVLTQLRSLEAKVIEKDSAYWHRFEQAKHDNPQLYYAVNTFHEAARCIQALESHDPAGAEDLLARLRDRHRSSALESGNQAQTLQFLATRMMQAIEQLLAAHPVDDDKQPKMKNLGGLSVPEAIRKQLQVWRAANAEEGQRTATAARQAAQRFESMQKHLEEMRLALDALQQKAQQPAAHAAPEAATA